MVLFGQFSDTHLLELGQFQTDRDGLGQIFSKTGTTSIHKIIWCPRATSEVSK